MSKPAVIVSILALLFMGGLFFTTNDTQAQTPVYNIGDTGPAGGIVFYDKGNYSGGWRYLEAAPEDQSTGCEWGGQGILVPGVQGPSIGSGYSNTAEIVRAYGKKDSAAKIASLYNGGGKNDWYLPSKDELKALYENLHKSKLGNFANYGYWSSTEQDAKHAWYHGFKTGSQKKFNKYNSSRVRAIRCF